MKVLLGLFAFGLLILGIIISLVGVILFFVFPQLEGTHSKLDFLFPLMILILGVCLIRIGNKIAKGVGKK